MAVEVVEKKKRGLTCAECGTNVAGNGTPCPECGSKEVKKSLVIVRKSVADTDEEIDALDPENVDEDEDLDDDDEADDEDESDDDDDVVDEDDDDDDDDDDEDDDEDEDEEDDDEVDAAAVKKNLALISVEALNIGTALAEDIQKVFAGDNVSRADYERVMNEMNNIMDAAAENWFSGSTVSKSIKNNVTAISKRVDAITKGKTVAKSTKITKRADLPEDVRKSLEAADKIVEENEERKWLDVAKKYTDAGYPGTPEKLAKSLRVLSETNEDAYKTMIETLDSGSEIIGKSALFETQGGSGHGAPEEVRKANERKAAAEELVSKGQFKSVEAAMVSLMNGADYAPTNA